MARLFRTAILIVFILSAKSAFAQHTYYISKSLGSDSNTASAAQSKSTPWAHLPGMQGNNGAPSYTPVAGDSFILYGGDSWVAADIGVYYPTGWSGSSANCVLPYGTGATSSCIYIGVDQTWYNSSVCGASFCRPIFNCGGAECSAETNGSANGSYFAIFGDYIVIDNIEMKGLCDCTGGEGFVNVQSDHVEVRNSYFHGWTHAAGVGNNGAAFTCGNGSCVGTAFDNNVVDGSDTTQDMMNGIFGSSVSYVYNNIFNYLVSSMVETNVDVVHDNVFENYVTSFAGDHCNGMFLAGPFTTNNELVYNNVFRNLTSCGGGVKVWLNYGQGSSSVIYFFNNVEDNLDPSNILDTCKDQTNCGTFNLFNNTIQCGNDSSYGCNGGTISGPQMTATWKNNHWITNVQSGAVSSWMSSHAYSTGTSIIDPSGYIQQATTGGTSGRTIPTFNESGGTTSDGSVTWTNTSEFGIYGYSGAVLTVATDLQQALANANGQGYNDTSETYAFSPASNCTSATCSTLSAGTNLQSLCTTIAGINPAAGTACQSSTTYAVGYNTTTHTVTSPALVPTVRPTSAAWDIGAYQFSGSQTQAPQPPTDLQATVN